MKNTPEIVYMSVFACTLGIFSVLFYADLINVLYGATGMVGSFGMWLTALVSYVEENKE
jgi:uncharacterized protein with PQ loop repeat